MYCGRIQATIHCIWQAERPTNQAHSIPRCKTSSTTSERNAFWLRAKVEEKIKELIDKDIIEHVEKTTPWASPVVFVPKANNDIACV